jgi:hypothetical protein
MPDTLPQTSFVKEMFESVERLFNAGLIDGVLDSDLWLKEQRSHLYSRLLKLPPARRLSQKEALDSAADGMKGCLFAFYGEVYGAWVMIATYASPQSADAMSLFTNPDIFIDADGWFYNIIYPNIKLGVYKP